MLSHNSEAAEQQDVPCVRFEKPVRAADVFYELENGEVLAVFHTRDNRRTSTGAGEILLPDGKVTVEGTGKYITLPLDEITDFDVNREEWRVTPDPHDPREIEL